jgi:sugar O-acyltransferase (sialic acid O-acetyltransferase NeuD family)
LILFGIRSPIVVDYEISAERSSRGIAYGVSVSGHPRVLNDIEIVELADLDVAPASEALPCAFSPKRREELAAMAREAGFTLAEALKDPTAILPPKLRIGLGSFINAGAVVGGACVFGEGVLVNRSASIGHHTVLGNYVSIGPGAILSGNVRVGRNCMIGAGAVIQSGVRIGENALISAGSVVRKHVEGGALVAGNPAKTMPFRARHSSLDYTGGE